MTNDQQSMRVHQTIRQLLTYIRRSLLFGSQCAVLLTLAVLVWYRKEPVEIPGFDVSTLPFDYLLPSVRLVEATAVAAIAAYALSGWPNFKYLLRGAQVFFVLALLGLCLWSTLSISWALNAGMAAVQSAHLAIWILFALVLTSAEWPLPRLVAFFASGLLLQCAMSLIQVTTQHYVGLSPSLGELPIKPEYTWVSVVFDGPRRLMRAYGFSSHPNILGGHAAIGAVLSFGLIVIWPRIWRALAVMAWALIWVLLLITFSRSAWLAMASGAVTAAVLLWRARLIDRRAVIAFSTTMLIGLIVGAAFWLIFQPFLIGRADASTQPLEGFSISQRAWMLDVAGQLIRDRPVFGVGAANFISAASALLGYPLDWVHNVPVLITSELGLPGLGLFVLLVGSLIAVGVRRWRQRSITLWSALIGGALVGLSSVMLFDHYLWTEPQGTLLFAVLMGLWMRPND